MTKKELDVEVSDLIFSANYYGDWTADDFERHLRDVASECGVTLKEARAEVAEQDRLANEYVDEAHAERQQLGLTSL
jgi:hypothetical protein